MKEESKFTPTKAWRLRQRLDFRIGKVKDALDCLLLSRERKQFDRANFGFSLRELEKELPKLARFYRRFK